VEADEVNDKYVLRSPRTAARRLGDETIVLAIPDSTLFSLNEVASLIWQAADGRTPLQDIVTQAIVTQFEVDADTAYRDALELVEELARRGLFEIAETPITPEAR
jgi:hypothetical protein